MYMLRYFKRQKKLKPKPEQASEKQRSLKFKSKLDLKFKLNQCFFVYQEADWFGTDGTILREIKDNQSNKQVNYIDQPDWLNQSVDENIIVFKKYLFPPATFAN